MFPWYIDNNFLPKVSFTWGAAGEMSSFSSYTRCRMSAYRSPPGSLVREGETSRGGEGARIIPLWGLGASSAEPNVLLPCHVWLPPASHLFLRRREVPGSFDSDSFSHIPPSLFPGFVTFKSSTQRSFHTLSRSSIIHDLNRNQLLIWFLHCTQTFSIFQEHKNSQFEIGNETLTAGVRSASWSVQPTVSANELERETAPRCLLNAVTRWPELNGDVVTICRGPLVDRHMPYSQPTFLQVAECCVSWHQ